MRVSHDELELQDTALGYGSTLMPILLRLKAIRFI